MYSKGSRKSEQALGSCICSQQLVPLVLVGLFSVFSPCYFPFYCLFSMANAIELNMYPLFSMLLAFLFHYNLSVKAISSTL